MGNMNIYLSPNFLDSEAILQSKKLTSNPGEAILQSEEAHFCDKLFS